MKTSIMVGGATHADMQSTVEFVQHAERLGVDYAWSAEGWSQDAVTSCMRGCAWRQRRRADQHAQAVCRLYSVSHLSIANDCS